MNDFTEGVMKALTGAHGGDSNQFSLRMCRCLLVECDGLDDVLRPRAASAGCPTTVVEREQEADSAHSVVAGGQDGLHSLHRCPQTGDVDGGSGDRGAGDAPDHRRVAVGQPASSGHQVGQSTSTASGQAHLQGVGSWPADVHPQGGTRQKHTPAGHCSGNGPHTSLGRAQSVGRSQVAQDVDQQPGIEPGAPEHLHVLRRKRAQNWGQRAGGQVGHGGVAGYRDKTSHMPSWTSTGRGCHSEPASCG